MAVSTRTSRVVLIWSSEKCAEARAQMSPQGAPDPECGLRPVRISPVSVSLFPPLGNPTPQADRGACGHTIPRWPCTGLLMIGESVAGLSRRLRVSFGVESRPPQDPQIVYFCLENPQYTIYPVLEVMTFVRRFRCCASSSWVLFANKILQIGRMHVVGPVRDLAGMVPGIGG